MLFGWQLLYSSNTTSTVVGNLTVLSSTTDKINRISNHFLDRWDMNLRETNRTSKLNIDSLRINITDTVLVFYEKVPRPLWKISIVTWVLPSRDSEIREVIVRIEKTNTILKRPVNKLFAVENTYHDNNQTDKASHKEIFPLLPCESWIFVKENPDRKKANSTLQHLRTDFQSMMGEERLNALSLYIFIEIYFLIMTK